MVKATEQNDKLNRAVIVSVVLHILLIALLIWGSLHENAEMSSAGGGDGSVVGAVMVDPGAVVEQYNRQQQQGSDAQRAEKQRQKKAAQQAEELQQKQAAEQERLKELKQERLAVQEKAAQDAKAQAEQQKAAEAAAAKAKEQQKAAEQAAAKAKVEADKIAKAQADTKKKAAEAAKQSAVADDLIGSLADGKNAPKGGGAAKTAGESGVDSSGYESQIKAAIESKFYASGFEGKTCDLRIRLQPDGFLSFVEPAGGDPALCQAAVAAAKQAHIPKPPSDAVYQKVKNAIIVFNPQ